jgi:hypothetical protein
MFRTSYVHHQEDCIVHAALYGVHSMQTIWQVEGGAVLPDDERKMFQTCRGQEELD